MSREPSAIRLFEGFNCFDNAVAESFFVILKTEIDLTNNLSASQVRQTIFDYIKIFYNRKRLPLMTVDFVVTCPLVPMRLSYIRFLSASSRICSTLLSDLASRLRPCTSLHFIVIRLEWTFTSNKPGTHKSGVCVSHTPLRKLSLYAGHQPLGML
ncbi:MAG: IS3 family transposase [Candidatus Obscuribacterales bacterium]|nr:IS3 family transposase [Candidatus Obscuribacterales bacterium]